MSLVLLLHKVQIFLNNLMHAYSWCHLQIFEQGVISKTGMQVDSTKFLRNQSLKNPKIENYSILVINSQDLNLKGRGQREE